MANSLFRQATSRGSGGGVPMALLQAARGNPVGVFDQLVQANPRFAEFVADNRGKSPRQIAQEHGVDLSQAVRMMGGAR